MKAPMPLTEQVQMCKDLLSRLAQLRDEAEARLASHLAAGTAPTAEEVAELQQKIRAVQLDRMRLDATNN
jgi:hypothetical protein